MLLTRSPLSPEPKPRFSLDLHVLSAPPAFVLSQDQTLREETTRPWQSLPPPDSSPNRLPTVAPKGVPRREAETFWHTAEGGQEAEAVLRFEPELDVIPKGADRFRPRAGLLEKR